MIAGSSARVFAMKYTPNAARNLPITMPVTLTGAVMSAWSVLFLRSSLMLRIVMIGIIIMLNINMVLNTCVMYELEPMAIT